MKKQQGFSLVEISIVLVIIGLVLGGVLKGQEMIANAKIKNLKKQVDGVSAAFYSYLDRYNSLPGDDPQASIHVSGTNATGTTAGNGYIDGSWVSTTATDESRLVWDHLRLAGFLSGSGTDNPHHAYGGKIGIQDNTYGMRGNVLCLQNIPGDVALQYEIKFDNGDDPTDPRGSGTVRSGSPTAGTYSAASNYTLCTKL